MLSRFLDIDSGGSYLRRLLPALETGTWCLKELSVRDVSVRNHWIVVYQATLTCVATGEERIHSLAVQHVSEEKWCKMSAALERDVAAWTGHEVVPRLVAHAPAHGLMIYPFPIDPSLRYLSRVAEPSQFLRRVRRWILPDLAPEYTDQSTVTPLRWVPGRRSQILYRFLARDGRELRMLGKIFAREGAAEQLHEVMNRVADVFDRHGDPALTAPRSLGCLSQWNCVVQEFLPGETLFERFLLGHANEDHIRAAARCLAVLHGSDLVLDSRYEISDEVALIVTAHEKLAGSGCLLRGSGEVLNQIRRTADQLPPCRYMPVHRDFYDKQLLVDGKRAALIDLDSITMGPPEIDLANFLAHLQLRQLQGHGPSVSDDWRDAFLDEYRRWSPVEPDPELIEFFEATTYFRLACLYRLRSSGDAVARLLMGAASGAASQPSVLAGEHA